MAEDLPNQTRKVLRRRRWRALMVMAGLGFVLGSGGVVALGWGLGLVPGRLAVAPAPLAAPAPVPAASAPGPQGAVEWRVSALEQRLARLDLESAAAEGNAARAEALLVAFAARRVVERGATLGYLEDQLKLRFGGAQPEAVATIIATARQPVTLDRLAAQLDAMAPRLANAPSDESVWTRLQRELANLFVLRREAGTPAPDPAFRLDHARMCLREGRVEDAIADVERMPGSAAAAQGWIAGARRYIAVERALDLIETTAVLEPRTLRDNSGNRVVQPSPLALPPPDAGAEPDEAPATPPAPAAAASSAPLPARTPAPAATGPAK